MIANHGQAVALVLTQRRRTKHGAILLRGIPITAGVVIGVAQATQLGRRQGRLGAHRGEAGAGNLRVLGEGVAQQQSLKIALSRIAMAQRELHQSLASS